MKLYSTQFPNNWKPSNCSPRERQARK